MQDTITFYYNPMSRGQIVHWMLEEVGVPYEFKILDWKKSEHKSPEYLKINPMGKIPSIVHRGTVVTEGAAICTYLADAFPEKGLMPAANDPQRGSFYRWMFFTVNCFEPAVADKVNPRHNHIPSMQQAYGTFEDTMRVLKDAVKEKFILGDKFSAVDVYLSAVINWYFFQKMIDPDPILQSYVQRCQDRPSHQRFSEQIKRMMP